MAKQSEADLEPEDDDSGSDWYRTESTKRFEKVLIANLTRSLGNLVGTAQGSSDPRVSAAHAEYLNAKTALLALVRMGRGKEANLDVKLGAP